jgi:ABC-type maltose transport system permease subunit
MSTEWGLYAAGALVVATPVVVLFMVLNRVSVNG